MLLQVLDTRLETLSVQYEQLQEDTQSAQLLNSDLLQSYKHRYTNYVSNLQKQTLDRIIRTKPKQ